MSKLTTCNQQKINKIEGIENAVAGVDGLTITTIYTIFGVTVLRETLISLGRLIIFPLTVVIAWVRALLSCRKAYLHHNKPQMVANAVLDVLSALAVSVAIIGAICATIAFAVVTPIIFIAIPVVRAIYNFVSAGRFFIKSLTCHEQDAGYLAKKEKYQNLAKQHLIGGLANCVAAVVTGLVMLASKFVWAFLGVGLGLFGVGAAIVQGVKKYRAYRVNLARKRDEADELIDKNEFEHMARDIPLDAGSYLKHQNNEHDPIQKKSEKKYLKGSDSLQSFNYHQLTNAKMVQKPCTRYHLNLKLQQLANESIKGNPKLSLPYKWGKPDLSLKADNNYRNDQASKKMLAIKSMNIKPKNRGDALFNQQRDEEVCDTSINLSSSTFSLHKKPN